MLSEQSGRVRAGSTSETLTQYSLKMEAVFPCKLNIRNQRPIRLAKDIMS